MANVAWTHEPTDASFEDFFTWPWIEGMDGRVAVDLTRQLAPLEVPTNVTRSLWQLKEVGETDDIGVTSQYCVGEPEVVGNVVKQRIAGLERGRRYRLYFLHGEAGNMRPASVMIPVGP